MAVYLFISVEIYNLLPLSRKKSCNRSSRWRLHHAITADASPIISVNYSKFRSWLKFANLRLFVLNYFPSVQTPEAKIQNEGVGTKSRTQNFSKPRLKPRLWKLIDHVCKEYQISVTLKSLEIWKSRKYGTKTPLHNNSVWNVCDKRKRLLLRIDIPHRNS